MQKEDRLLSKVNRIEERMMQKEIYNYTFIQQEIKRKRELAEAQAAKTKEEGKSTPH